MKETPAVPDDSARTRPNDVSEDPRQSATPARRPGKAVGILGLLFTGGLFGLAIHAWRSRRSEPLLTLARYQLLEPGMPLALVCEILGSAGQVASTTATRRMMTWRNSAGARFAAVFEDGILLSFGGSNLS